MPEMGTLPIDWTVCLFAGVLNALEEGFTWRAMKRMATEFDVENVTAWTNLQVAMGDRLQHDLDGGLLSSEQFDFALTWLANLDQVPFAESCEQFMAWAEWVRTEKVFTMEV